MCPPNSNPAEGTVLTQVTGLFRKPVPLAFPRTRQGPAPNPMVPGLVAFSGTLELAIVYAGSEG